MKPTPFPKFRYHPDPVATGAVEASDETCTCCVEVRGFVYVAGVYCEDEPPEPICPWCIADGAAAEEYECTYTDGPFLNTDFVKDEVIEEVTTRTPGYLSVQENDWRICCNDACAYHGEASKEDIVGMSDEVRGRLLDELNWPDEDWAEFAKTYKPGGDGAMHKFICLHCKQPTFSFDPS